MNKEDTVHIIVTDKHIEAPGILHRFRNSAGVPYSAIYVDYVEVASCPREREAELLDWWNSWEG
ncbi:MAG: hypothetical protein IKY89_05480 [Alistipes sp.]|nr:hypothetical protein [Alistipes sp.]